MGDALDKAFQDLKDSQDDLSRAARESVEASARGEFGMIALSLSLNYVEPGKRQAAERDISAALLAAYNKGKNRKTP